MLRLARLSLQDQLCPCILLLTDVLHRYTAHMKLATTCVEHLNRNQLAIQNIHITECENPHLLLGLPRQNITVGFAGKQQQTDVFFDFAKGLSPLETLSISFRHGWTLPVREYWNGINDPLLGRKVCAKGLSISGCMPVVFTSKLHLMFDLNMLTSLSLFDNNLYLLVEHLAPFAELRNLTRFQWNTRDSMMPEHTSILHDFFVRNAGLEHVHLSVSSIGGVICAPDQVGSEPVVATGSLLLWPLRHQLRTLAWHDAGGMRATFLSITFSSNSLTVKSFEFVCRNFTRLQQLAVQAPEQLHICEREIAQQTELWHWKGRQTFLTYLVSPSHFIICSSNNGTDVHRSRSYISKIWRLSIYARDI
jgi:hypothetical protein